MSVQIFQIIPMADAVKQAELYCLEELLSCYGEEDIADAWTLRVHEDGPVEVDETTIIGQPLQAFMLVQMGSWTNDGREFFKHCVTTAFRYNDNWYVFVDDNDYPEWM